MINENPLKAGLNEEDKTNQSPPVVKPQHQLRKVLLLSGLLVGIIVIAISSFYIGRALGEGSTEDDNATYLAHQSEETTDSEALTSSSDISARENDQEESQQDKDDTPAEKDQSRGTGDTKPPEKQLTVISGEMSYPSEFIPQLELCAENVNTGEKICETYDKSPTKYIYKLEVEPGSYYVRAKLVDSDIQSYFVFCDAHKTSDICTYLQDKTNNPGFSCSDDIDCTTAFTPEIVEVQQGEYRRNIDIFEGWFK